MCFASCNCILKLKEVELMDDKLPKSEFEPLRLKLKLVKRRVTLHKDFLYGKAVRRNAIEINRMVYLTKYFETKFEIERGDVFLAYFYHECGSELEGKHLVVAFQNSSELSQIITVVPLSSLKEGKAINPAGGILLGEIPGLPNGKQAVALVNHLRVIDKRRMIDKEAVEHFYNYCKTHNNPDYDEIVFQTKTIYRLTEEQYKKLHKAVSQYILNGYIEHQE